MKSKYVKGLLGLVLSSFTFSANALTVFATVGQTTSLQSGAVIETFDSNELPETYFGGGLFNTTTGNYATPVGSEGNYWSIGTSEGQEGPGYLSFEKPVSYFGFLWGSPDSYNIVNVFNGKELIGSYTGEYVKEVANGDQTYSAYFEIFANRGELFTYVQFISNGNAFETDNHAFINFVSVPVPEPESYTMLLVGLGLLGVATRKKGR